MLHFRALGIPVTVQPFFWLIAILLGQGWVSEETWLRDMALWIGVVFVGVLLHEFGHAFAGRAFGLVPAIELHGMGGATSWLAGGSRSAKQRVLIAAAGPAVGIVIGLVSLGVLVALKVGGAPTAVTQVLTAMVWVNLGWGMLNLIPMLPMDGGHVMTSSLEVLTRDAHRSRLWGHGVSFVVALALGAFILLRAFSVWNALLVGLFAFTNLQAYRALRAAR